MISSIFVFAPVPLTKDLSPLAHAGILARRRQAESSQALPAPRKPVEAVEADLAEPALV